MHFSGLGPFISQSLSSRLWVSRQASKTAEAKSVNFVLVPSALSSSFICGIQDPDGEQPCLSTSDVRSLANEAIVCHYLIKEECMHVLDWLHVWETCPGGMIGCHHGQWAFAWTESRERLRKWMEDKNVSFYFEGSSAICKNIFKVKMKKNLNLLQNWFNYF